MRGTCETVNESAQCLFCMLIPRGLFKSSRGFIGNMAVQYLTSTLLLLNHWLSYNYLSFVFVWIHLNMWLLSYSWNCCEFIESVSLYSSYKQMPLLQFLFLWLNSLLIFRELSQVWWQELEKSKTRWSTDNYKNRGSGM